MYSFFMIFNAVILGWPFSAVQPKKQQPWHTYVIPVYPEVLWSGSEFDRGAASMKSI
jgi:hypothetical protein